MTELTDAVQGAKGKTVLYTPQDDLENVQQVARDQVCPSCSQPPSHAQHHCLTCTHADSI